MSRGREFVRERVLETDQERVLEKGQENEKKGEREAQI